MSNLTEERKEQFSDCPDEQTWWELAAGTLDITQAELNVQHATRCSQCSASLLKATSIFSSETSIPEEEELKGLLSSTSEWQSAMASRMRESVVRTRGSRLGVSFASHSLFWWGAGLAASLAIAAGLAWFLLRPPTENQLLAEAYTHHRTTELRLSEGEPGRLISPSRGAPLVAVAEVLQLKLRAAEHLQKHTNDPHWHQVLGETALIEHDAEVARTQFQIARVLNPALPRLQLEEGMAYFELAEAKGDPIFYARAAESFSAYVEANGDLKSSALFDRGLSYERQNLYTLAATDYEAAFDLENDLAWRTEIQSHLKAVRAHSQKSEMNAPIDESPGTFLASVGASPTAEDARYEFLLNLAGRRWLPLRHKSAVADKALLTLGKIGMKHGDAWLIEWLSQPASAISRLGDKHLAAALRASAEGSTDAARAESEQAAAFYLQSSDGPGLLRARAEIVYTLQRLGRQKECRLLADDLLRDPAFDRYSWLHGYLLLEASACTDSPAPDPFGKEAFALTQRYGLPVEELRARGFLAEDALSAGQLRNAWTLSVSGLGLCADRAGVPMRRYQFLYDLSQAASQLGLTLTSAALADAATESALRSGNKQIGAYALEDAGVAQLQAHHPNAASDDFLAAAKTIEGLPNGNSTRLYRADWQADRSAVLAQKGDLVAALDRMAAAEQSISPSSMTSVKLPFYTQFAQLMLQAHRPEKAEHYASLAATQVEQELAPRSALNSALMQLREARGAYVALVESLLEQHKTELALCTWEWFRSAAYRPPAKANQTALAFANIARPPSGTVTLVFARLNSAYVVWTIPPSPSPVTVMQLPGDPNETAALTRILHAICANPESALLDVDLLASALYLRILAPVKAQIQPASTLRLHLDDGLRRVPIDALLTPDHTSVGQKWGVLFLDDGWPLHPMDDAAITRESPALVVQGSPSGIRQTFLPAEYDESQEVAALFTHSVLLETQYAEPERVYAEISKAHIFHYSGHTESTSRGLVVGQSGTAITPQALGMHHFAQCRLAVLAACQTADLDEDSLQEDTSLAQSVLQAGAAEVLASSWNVDSSATRQLVLRFYQVLLQGKSPDVALQSAKQSLRSLPGSQHPYFWAGFQLFAR